jgi:alkyl sulfatase BDS1-like metallo-beta-lactamase superfamily hydrolase
MWIERTLTLVLALAFPVGFSPAAVAAGGGDAARDPGAMEGRHFDPKGKMPSKYTIELQKGLRATLPFEDKRDFEETKKGFVAAPPYEKIMAEAGNVAWDMGTYEFPL